MTHFVDKLKNINRLTQGKFQEKLRDNRKIKEFENKDDLGKLNVKSAS